MMINELGFSVRQRILNTTGEWTYGETNVMMQEKGRWMLGYDGGLFGLGPSTVDCWRIESYKIYGQLLYFGGIIPRFCHPYLWSSQFLWCFGGIFFPPLRGNASQTPGFHSPPSRPMNLQLGCYFWRVVKPVKPPWAPFSQGVGLVTSDAPSLSSFFNSREMGGFWKSAIFFNSLWSLRSPILTSGSKWAQMGLAWLSGKRTT